MIIIIVIISIIIIIIMIIIIITNIVITTIIIIIIIIIIILFAASYIKQADFIDSWKNLFQERVETSVTKPEYCHQPWATKSECIH